MGSSLKGGSMQKIYLLLLSLFIGLFLSGCTSGRADLVLTGSSGQELLEVNADESAQGADSENDPGGGDFTEDAGAPVEPEDKSIFVYVCGAVNSPGVYELEEDSRVTDAVEAAGGFSEDADRDYVNLAALLADGIRLKIPTSEETSMQDLSELESFDKPGVDAGTGGSDNLININSASVSELTALPGIGQSTAEKIIKYRDEHGRFKSKEDIMNVSGIKDKLFSRICDQITV